MTAQHRVCHFPIFSGEIKIKLERSSTPSAIKMSGDLYPSLESLKPVRLHAKLEIALHSKTNQEKLVASSGPAFRIRH